MEIGPQWIVSSKLNTWLWFVLVPIFITHASSRLDKPVGREITNDNHPDYLDPETGIRYQTDEDFVETGSNHKVSSSVDLSYPYFGKQLNTLRSFPEGDRNCYTLKPKQGKNNNYLIRAFFSYGNYDSKNETSSFDLYIGVNYWYTINIDLDNGYTFVEVIHTPSCDTIQLCLVKTGPTIPYISSLELRPLNNSIYQTMSSTTSQPLLHKQLRIDVGFRGFPTHSRYKDDVYDRLWRYDKYEVTNSWLPLDESIDMDPSTSAYKLPAQVLRTASQSLNVSYPLKFDYDSLFNDLDTNYEYRVYFHFAEIEALPPGQNRIINITLNSKPVLSHPLVLQYMKPVTISPQDAVRGRISFSISATSESAAPPILNAFEAYKLIPGLYSPTDARDAGAIMDIKSAYHITWLNWQGDQCLPKQFAWEGLTCNSDTNPRITALNLSSSKLTGEINISFSYLTVLEILDLSNNYLEGPVPEFLAELTKLKLLNLTGNKLSGPIPKALKKKADTTLQLSVTDNPYICMSHSCERKNFVAPLVASVSALIVIILIALGFWIIKRRPKVMRSDSQKGRSLKYKHRAFSYSEILNITENFKTIIGEGGFGKVYFGTLQDNTEVAVKLLSPSSMQGYKEFRSEAQLLMIVHHRNLVSLIGYCDEGDIKALIYEYMANGNVQQHLSVDNPNVLKWNERLIVAVDAAQGLDYLHNGCKPPLIHRDLKTSNILLDQNMHAKISDFGLCRAFGNDIDSHISTRPAGTAGYVDPEFQRTGNSTKKSDIYSFGIILFELITGQQAVLRAPGRKIHILEWVIPIVERGDIQNVIDPRLQEKFNVNSAWKAIEIALSCISPVAA
ncbi:putative leucine-rich repeat receptor-like protein kinase At2g19210 isoform X2 [Abrus precatorius]|uniref:non-specific serine/threonine protein kinase n=1 Tax=Abrus precatorius TaxID=3816 RepID=A0A8B8JSP4_ABRPR|nr:putative leucine-rich repeat receptor-like protein kinase At2g19210 isoform X2 [Abrus precatorius]